MVRMRQTPVPGEGHSSGELAGVEHGSGGQQQSQQIPEHHGGYQSGGRSGYQSAGGRLRPQGEQQAQQIPEHEGGYQRGGRSGYQFAGGRLPPQGQQQSQQIPEHHGGYQSGGRSGNQSGRRGGHTGGRGGHTGGRGGRGPPHGGMAPQLPQPSQPQRCYAGPEYQQNCGIPQQFPREGATTQPGPSRPRSSYLHQAPLLPYQVAPSTLKLLCGSPTESLGDDSSQAPQQHPRGDAKPQPRGGRPPYDGPSRLQSPDLHQAISPYQPPYRSAPSSSKVPFGSPTKYLGDDSSSSQAPQQHPRGDTKPQPRGGGPPYGGSTSLSPDLHQAILPYQSATNTSKAPFGCPTKSPGDDSSSSQAPHLSSANGSQQSFLSQKLVPASSIDMRFPLRPGMGTRGTKCTVTANHFFVKFPDKDLHQYDVTIIPEVTSLGLNRAVIKKLENLYKQSHLGGRLPVYDGRKSLYTAGPLPFDLKDFKITLVDEAGSNQGAGDNAGARKREFMVKIKLVARVDLHRLRMFLHGQKTDVPQEAVQALDIMLRELPTSKYVPFGSSFFSHIFGSKKHLGEGLESIPGFHQSIRPTQMGLSVNIDVSFTAFIEPLPVIEYVAQLLKRDISSSQPLSDADHAKIKKALRGIRIEVTHRGKMRRKYCISGLTPQATRELTFPIDESGTLKSVVEYFHETYESIIHYTWLPCLLVGNQKRPIYLPMEVCKIVPGQRYSKKLNKVQIANLLRETCKPPHERKTNIYKTVKEIDYAKDEYTKEFGLEISPVMAQVAARVLPAPQLKYHDSGLDKDCLPHGGVWSMKNKKMVNGGKVDHWICLNFASSVNDHTALGFCQELAKICSNSGMTFNRNPVMPPRKAYLNQVESVLKASFHNAMTRLQGKELDLLIVILPDKNCSIYGELKRICDTDLGLVSQCCSAENVLKDRNKQYQCLVNLSLKINVKVGGRNTVLADALSRRIPNVSDCPTIIFGADVTHPQPGDSESPSIAAVVASQDWPEITKYASLASAQAHRQEIIEELFTSYEDPNKGTVTGGMIKDLLISFRTANGCLPEKIIFYRDGVSEGQFDQVLLYEVGAIQRACASLDPNYQPRITFVVVQKRHHTRLFPNDPKFADKSGNIPAGTVVDREIGHPTQFDFFLCSHAGIKGTSRPAHYHILWDENQFSADDLQTLTYNLCYTYARCTRSVSIVPPAYYAHLAAFRARCYIESETSDSGSVGASRAPPGANVNVKPLPALKENVKRGMFFC